MCSQGSETSSGGGGGSSSSATRSSSRRTSEEPHIGKYRLLKTIGKGNFAKVKLAKHIPTGKEVNHIRIHIYNEQQHYFRIHPTKIL